MLRRIKLQRPELRVPRRLQEKLNGNTQHLILGVIQPVLEDCRSHAVFPWSHHIFTLAAQPLLFLPDENEVIWTLAYTVVKTSCNDHQGTICPPGWHLLEVVTWAHHGKLWNLPHSQRNGGSPRNSELCSQCRKSSPKSWEKEIGRKIQRGGSPLKLDSVVHLVHLLPILWKQWINRDPASTLCMHTFCL